MEKGEDKKQDLFRHRLAERYPSEAEKKVKVLCMKFAMLHETLPSVTECNDRGNLKYFSKLYSETLPLVTHVTRYVVENDYSGRKKKVDDLVIRVQQVLGLLKVLHLRYESLRLPPKFDHLEWWKYSQKENREILKEMKKLLEEM